MKTIYKFLSVLIIPSILILYSYSSGSPGGKTGSIGDGGTTCTQCHAGTASGQSGWITTNIPSEGYTTGETYTITVTGTHSGVVKMGFEVTAENISGSKKGSWTVTDAGRTKLANANSSVTHTSGGNTPTGNTNTWSANWTAPSSSTGQIKFNTAVNAANGNGSTSGDQIYTSLITVDEVIVLDPQIVSVSPDHGRQDSEEDYLITGDETLWLEGVANVMFKYHDDSNITLTPQSFTVDNDSEITAVLAITEDQQLGLYDVYVDDIMLENAFTVDILDAVYDDIASRINIYPNPTQNYLKLELPEGSEYRIISIDGRMMSDFKLSDRMENINVSTLQNGIYFVQIKNNKETFTKKFVKK